MALPSENRLKSEPLISLVCKKGASWKTPFFRAVFFPSPQKKFQSVVVVSKKYDKRATERNLIRRKINGCLQQKLSEKNTTVSQKFPDYSYVIFPYESAKNTPPKEIEASIEKMLISTKNWNFTQKKKQFRGKR